MTPLICPACGTQTGELENLEPNNPSIAVACPKCGLTQTFDTVVNTEQGGN